MEFEPEPRVVARGSWAQDEHGDLIYGPEGLPPAIADRLTEATQSLWSGATPEPGRGYRIRSTDVWDQARMDYLAGDTAEAVCDRYGLKEGTLRDRAAKHGWRRVDQADLDPAPLERPAEDLDDDAPAPDYGDMAARALLRADRAIARGRAAEAASWLRLHARLGELSAPVPGRSPAPPPRPATVSDRLDVANQTSRAVTQLANQLGRTDPADPIARAALDARFEALMAETLADISDDSDDSDPVFFDAGSESGPAASILPKEPP